MAERFRIHIKNNIVIRTGKVIHLDIPPEGFEPSTKPEFPSSWFEQNTNQPPVLSIELTASSLEQISGVINAPMKRHQLRVEDACTFLFYKFQTIKEKTTAEWKSYNYVIAEAGSEITPLSVLKVESKVVNDRVFGSDFEDNDVPDDAKLFYILCIYRLINIKNDAFRGKVIQKLNVMMAKYQPGNTVVTFSENILLLLHWQKSKVYNQMIACFDMFMNKFPNNKYHQMKIGTEDSRMKSCAALTSISFIIEHMGYSGLKEFSQCIFANNVADELTKMYEKTEEIDEDNSYFPYHTDLGLTPKSPYSSVANPHLFLYIHVMGCMYGIERSKNAIFSPKSYTIITSLISNAVVSAYYKAKSDPDLVEQVRSALINSHGKIPDAIKEYFELRKVHLANSRKGTVGEYLATYIL